MKHAILALLLLASPALAEQSTLDRCENLLQGYVQLKIEVAQAGQALQIQKGITELCQKLIEAEKPKAEPTPAATKEPEKK